MTGGTHIMLGAAGGVVAAAVTDHPGWPHEMLILTAVVASMIPDLDEEKSMIHQYTMGHIHPKMRRPLVGLEWGCYPWPITPLDSFSLGFSSFSLHCFAIERSPTR